MRSPRGDTYRRSSGSYHKRPRSRSRSRSRSHSRLSSHSRPRSRPHSRSRSRSRSPSRSSSHSHRHSHSNSRSQGTRDRRKSDTSPPPRRRSSFYRARGPHWDPDREDREARERAALEYKRARYSTSRHSEQSSRDLPALRPIATSLMAADTAIPRGPAADRQAYRVQSNFKPDTANSNHQPQKTKNASESPVSFRLKVDNPKSTVNTISESSGTTSVSGDAVQHMVGILTKFSTQVAEQASLQLRKDQASATFERMVHEFEKGQSLHSSFPAAAESQKSRKDAAQKAMEVLEEKLSRQSAGLTSTVHSIATCIATNSEGQKSTSSEDFERKYNELSDSFSNYRNDLQATKIHQQQLDERYRVQMEENSHIVSIVQKDLLAFREDINAITGRFTILGDKINLITTDLDTRIGKISSQVDTFDPIVKSIPVDLKTQMENSLSKVDCFNTVINSIPNDLEKQLNSISARIDSFDVAKAEISNTLGVTDELTASVVKTSNRVDGLEKYLKQIPDYQVIVESITNLQKTEQAIRNALGVYKDEYKSMDDDLTALDMRLKAVELRPVSNSVSSPHPRGSPSHDVLDTVLAPLRDSLEDLKESQNGADAWIGGRLDEFDKKCENTMSRLRELKELNTRNISRLDETIRSHDQMHSVQIQELKESVVSLSVAQATTAAASTRSSPTNATNPYIVETKLNNHAHSLRQEFQASLKALSSSVEGVSIGIQHLDTRMNHLSTDQLARQMLGQLESVYPALRNADEKLEPVIKAMETQATATTGLQKDIDNLQSMVQVIQEDLAGHKLKFEDSKNDFIDNIRNLRSDLDELNEVEPPTSSLNGAGPSSMNAGTVQAEAKRKRDSVSTNGNGTGNKKQKNDGGFHVDPGGQGSDKASDN